MSLYRNSKNLRTLSLKILSNLVVGVLIFSVGVVCLSPLPKNVTTESKKETIYRSAGENTGGVSLLFNVYWGTDEVYQILEVLDKYTAKATFFIGGCWADDNVECLKAMYERGHEIGNHGYFHKDHTRLSLVENQKEIKACNRFIELAIGVKATLFAPPSGAYSNETLTACDALGMKTILWSKDTIDWRDKDASLIYTRATKGVKNGDFILMHPMAATVNALDDILKYYQNNSLKVVTVSENIQENG